jgi:hypothetical protein
MALIAQTTAIRLVKPEHTLGKPEHALKSHFGTPAARFDSFQTR